MADKHPKLKQVGNNLVGKGLISWFGGPKDSEDSGKGAWGFNSIKQPYAPYCSLPITYIEKYDLKAGQKVTVQYKDRQVECFLSDKGPGHPDPSNPANSRLIDVGEYVILRLGCKTDSEVKIYIPVGEIVAKEKQC